MHATLMAVIAVLGLCNVCAHAQGAAYPAKPIRLVAPFPPGGSSDLVGRIVGQGLNEAWGQPVVIDNRAGAAGSVGSAMVAKSVPDGYTLLFAGIGPVATNVHLYKDTGYDPVRDFTAISGVAAAPNILVVHPSVAARTTPELVALARQKPEALLCGSGGIGTPAHLNCELMRLLAKAPVLHVAYKGSGQSINDLLGGQIHMAFTSMPVAIPHSRAGRLRALGVASAQRTPQAPDVPTIAEAGIPGFIFDSWWGVFGPKGLPAPVTAKLAGEIASIAASPSAKERFAALGIDPFVLPPKAFADHVGSEVVRLGKLIKDAGIKAQ